MFQISICQGPYNLTNNNIYISVIVLLNMAGIETLPSNLLGMVLGLLDATTLQQVARVSPTMYEKVYQPMVWKERFTDVAGADRWGRDPEGYLELLAELRFSTVTKFEFTGTEEVTAEHWDRLTVMMEQRGNRYKTSMKLSGELCNISLTSLGRLVQTASCLDVGKTTNLTDMCKELLLVAIGLPASKVRHARLKGTSFGDDLQPVKFYLDNIVVKTWSFHTDKSSFTEAQLSDIDHGLAGSRRSMELVPANRCSLANCPVAAEEEELKARMDNVANDFLNFFNQAFNMA